MPSNKAIRYAKSKRRHKHLFELVELPSLEFVKFKCMKCDLSMTLPNVPDYIPRCRHCGVGGAGEGMNLPEIADGLIKSGHAPKLKGKSRDAKQRKNN